MFELAIETLQNEIDYLEKTFKETAELYGYNNVTVEEEVKDRDVFELRNAIKKLREDEKDGRK